MGTVLLSETTIQTTVFRHGQQAVDPIIPERGEPIRAQGAPLHWAEGFQTAVQGRRELNQEQKLPEGESC